MAIQDKGLTPMMKQFFSMKAKHPDALMLFRCGDFYETYGEDAVVAAGILGITLTKRNNSAENSIEMAGFPHHALDTYLPKLIRAGKRVAICDQLEDPKKKREEIKGKKGLSQTDKMVKRGITELVTPGIAISDNILNNKENNFLAAVQFGKAACGVSFLDISTGEFLTGEGSYDYVEKLLANFSPKEVLYNRERRADFQRYFGTKLCVFEMEDWVFTEQNSRQKLLKHFGTKSLKGFGVEHLKEGIIASGSILQYLEMTEHTHINHITSLARLEADKYVRMDRFTIRSLELLAPMQEEGRSLLSVIDRTVTPMGGRMLRRWLVFPLKEVVPIDERLDMVDYFFKDLNFQSTVDEQLHRMGDLERIASKIAVGRVTPREMVQLKWALSALKPIQEACLSADNALIQRMGKQLHLCEHVRDRIEKEIQNDPPQLVNKGDVIADGFNAELDDLRAISRNSKDYLLKLQAKEAEQTGINSLKIGFNNVFGYYLEVRNTFKKNVPETWIRKQTLAQAERYITPELKEYEEKILGAEEKILALEAKLFNELILAVQDDIPRIQADANLLAQLDVLLGFAKIARENHYIRPIIHDDNVLKIVQGRHPVIETQLPLGEVYVPNDVTLDSDKQQIMMITGPNMAGKSALLRQTALIVLMAQVGCFVPAEHAEIGLVDKIFTRVGASDNLSLGESTFMVEMTEAANILNNVSPRSLVLFDELGRGTSTYDGISIAWAIVEYLHEQPKARARTLFATHYHELNEMEKHFSRIKNYNVSVKNVDGKVIFLRKLQRGGSEHSFGIHVAEIAGMPRSIVKRANTVLKELEQDNAEVGAAAKPNTAKIAAHREGMELSFFQLDDPILTQIRDEILELDVNNLTPVEALNKLNEIKKILTGKNA
ncbi:MAG: DNA mismatch repair protein MutS [Prevotella sp.]|jgi:DNA mismatch repair protein mutS|uniref:DNA mismatch repair protein MutS n=1 Tax=Segatella oulorum TaxID=28136 RepID=A0A1T4LPX1_9BACT|nr:DNA mismatch repair protein MutS [Segatella oulorum]RKW50686.1 MAG: DNA mismatch repair protein MutS [Prevotella sp.]SJZ56691.1 DNA mismatch repair protein MutS [Segatella oulorum]